MAEEHWWHRLEEASREWFFRNEGAPLTDIALDAVIGASGIPVREVVGEGLPDSYLLSAEDWDYVREQRRANERD